MMPCIPAPRTRSADALAYPPPPSLPGRWLRSGGHNQLVRGDGLRLQVRIDFGRQATVFIIGLISIGGAEGGAAEELQRRPWLWTSTPATIPTTWPPRATRPTW